MVIKNIVIIGSGVMGAGIAALIANSSSHVTLLDIVPDKAIDRNILAKSAIEKMLSSKNSNLVSAQCSKFIYPGNIEDDVEKIAKADWVIEVVIEKLEIKQNIYKLIDRYSKKNTIISSNTSTILLKSLINNMSEKFKESFLITHFFNPPRHMKLVEIVSSKYTKQQKISEVSEFIERKLGKEIVRCKDTAGFIANRIGCYWLEIGLDEALKRNINIAKADQIISSAFSIPKTGIFGLWDLIGIDLMPLIAKSLITLLPNSDNFRVTYKFHDILQNMISEGYIGRKGKGGFYKIDNQGNVVIKQCYDLNNRTYINIDNNDKTKYSINDVMQASREELEFVKVVMLRTLAYCAQLVPEISSNICNIDRAMKLGYNWKYGPFELIDQIGIKNFTQLLEDNNIQIPNLLKKANGRNFYQEQKYLNLKGNYSSQSKSSQITIHLSNNKTETIIDASDASLVNIGNKVACFVFKTKMNKITKNLLETLSHSLDEIAKMKYRGLIIGNENNHFSVGADLEYFLQLINENKVDEIERFIKLGQACFNKLKYVKFPVICAHKGYALGGGAEILLHSTAIISYIEAMTGLVEAKVGLIPGWGGTKEMVIRANSAGSNPNIFTSIITDIVNGNIFNVFEIIKKWQKANTAIELSIERILSTAKEQILKNKFVPKVKKQHKLNPNMAIECFENILHSNQNFTTHDQLIMKKLQDVFTLGTNSSTISVFEDDILDAERNAFISLIKTAKTKELIENMLKNNSK